MADTTHIDHNILTTALGDGNVQNALKDVLRTFIHADLLSPCASSDLFGRNGDSFNIDLLAWLSAGISSSSYAAVHMQDVVRATDSSALLTHALSQADLTGMILEFGVFSGHTINIISSTRPAETIYGFDSFMGLPETWRSGFPKGAFAKNELPLVNQNVELIVGFFDRTLPSFLDRFPKEQPAAFIHVDCDLYSSTQCIFAQMKNRISNGTVILFDEYFNYPGWELHEFKAFQEFIAHTGLSYRYIGVVPSHQQVAVKIIGR